MRCPNCGSEIVSNSKFCEACGSQITLEMRKEQEQLNKQGCPNCGSSNISFNREKQGEVKQKNGLYIVRNTVGFCKDCGYTWQVADTSHSDKSNKTWLWVLGWIFIFPLPLTILLQRKKDMNPTIKVLGIVVAWLLYILIVVSGNSKSNDSKITTNSNSFVQPSITDNSILDEGSNNENEALKSELHNKYNVSEPVLIRNDKTGKLRLVRVSNSTPTSDYAVEYARAYMNDGDVHYIINFTIGTTTQLVVTSGKLSVKTTEHIKDEELDASTIGEGMLYSEQFFDLTTGVEISADGDKSAGTVSSKKLISAVKKAIPDALGKGEKIKDVTFKNKKITVIIDLSGADADSSMLKLIAEARTSSITDAILALDDSYYNTWEKIKIDFGTVGTITFKKSDVKTSEFGRYFEVLSGCFD